MITWILVLIVVFPQGVSTSSIIFHSPQSCAKAAQELVNAQPTKIFAFCQEDYHLEDN